MWLTLPVVKTETLDSVSVASYVDFEINTKALVSLAAPQTASLETTKAQIHAKIREKHRAELLTKSSIHKKKYWILDTS